jgi:hypothetical protein
MNAVMDFSGLEYDDELLTRKRPPAITLATIATTMTGNSFSLDMGIPQTDWDLGCRGHLRNWPRGVLENGRILQAKNIF